MFSCVENLFVLVCSDRGWEDGCLVCCFVFSLVGVCSGTSASLELGGMLLAVEPGGMLLAVELGGMLVTVDSVESTSVEVVLVNTYYKKIHILCFTNHNSPTFSKHVIHTFHIILCLLYFTLILKIILLLLVITNTRSIPIHVCYLL